MFPPKKQKNVNIPYYLLGLAREGTGNIDVKIKIFI